MADRIPAHAPIRWRYVKRGETAYAEALALQHRILAAVQDNRLDAGVVLALEHPPVFTLGRRGGRENLCVSEVELAARNIDVIHTERGGNITYHGPGQLVVYPIVRLDAVGVGVADFVGRLEACMIRTARDFGVEALRNPLNRGVWVGPRKLGSIGIAVRRGVTFHGLALNVDPDLAPFGYINPCGLENVSMTSLARELKREVSFDEARRRLTVHMAELFGVRLVAEDPDELESGL